MAYKNISYNDVYRGICCTYLKLNSASNSDSNSDTDKSDFSDYGDDDNNNLSDKKYFNEQKMDYVKTNLNELFVYACMKKYIKVAEWFYTLSKEDVDNFVVLDITYAFTHACHLGHLKVAKYVYNISIIDSLYTKININFDEDELFRTACYYGHPNLAKWLYNLSKEDVKSSDQASSKNYANTKININAKDDEAFKYACHDGHLKTAEWLYLISKMDLNTKININAQNDFAFRTACGNGHIKVAKWLYNLSKEDLNTKINIHAENNYAFKQVCLFGHNKKSINTAKWLYELSHIDANTKIDITENNHFIFKQACNDYNDNLAEWLCTLNENYSFTKNDDEQLIPNIANSLTCKLQTIFKLDNDQQKEKLDNLYKDSDIVNDESIQICPICLSNDEKYQVQLQCNHNVCIKCFAYAYEYKNKCHYKCAELIDFDNVKLIKVFK